MAKFTSYDGVDKNGVRAEVTVMTGTGVIKDLIGKGSPNETGEYRNYEVEFTPDNPMLKRRVYGLIDSNAAELWQYIRDAYASQKNVAYRIESQRRSGVDRATPLKDLVATEDIRRILAGVDGVMSHEAKTNPAEDPDGDNPSALAQAATGTPTAAAAVSAVAGAVPTAGVSVDGLLNAVAAARKAGLSSVTVDTLVGHALAAGATIEQVSTAGYTTDGKPVRVPDGVMGTTPAIEEKPWMPWNSDGRINYGSYAVHRAATAEQFALDHLIAIYTPTNSKAKIEVKGELIAQAAAVALTLMDLADKVQMSAYGEAGRPDRWKSSHKIALGLVLDTVSKRYPFPVGADEKEAATWTASVVAEASERMYGVGEIAFGNTPKSIEERQADAAAAAQARKVTPVPAATKAQAARRGKNAVADAAAALGATTTTLPAPSFVQHDWPKTTEEGFIAPDAATVTRVKALCETADVLADGHVLANWFERATGSRIVKTIHQPVLEAFATHYEQAGTPVIRAEVLASADA